jgi:digeranylgeranylglycerophospholipid reductase
LTATARLPERVDVLVAGAGPGGLAAASRLREAGASVLIVEARQVVGFPVRCGEIVTNDTFRVLGFEPRPKWVRCTLKARPGLPDWIVLDRERFELELSQLLASRGATVVSGARVVGVGPFDGEGRSVEVARDGIREKVRARCVIAADGVSSTVARLAGVATCLEPLQASSGLAYRMEGVTLADPERWHQVPVPRILSPFPHYFWVIPNEPGTANIGIYLPSVHASRLRPVLHRMMRASKLFTGGRATKTIAGLLAEARPLAEPCADGVIVIGGAARLVDPLGGGGIGSAVVSGDEAARTIRELGGRACTREALALYKERLGPLVDYLEGRWRIRRAKIARITGQAPPGADSDDGSGSAAWPM